MRAEPDGAEPAVAETWGAESTGVPVGASLRREPLSPPQLREWFARRWRLKRGAAGARAAGGPAGAGVAGGTAGAGAAGGAGALGAGGAADARAAGGAGAAGPGGARTRGTGAAGAGGAAGVGAGGASAVAAGGAPGAIATGGAGAGGAAGVGAGDPGARGTGVISAGSGGAVRPRPYFVPLLQQMALRPSTAPLCVPLPSPPASSLDDGSDPESDSLRATSPTLTRLMATVATNTSFESTAASALVAELVDFAVACRLDYAASLVAESESEQEEFECFAAALSHLVSMLIAPEGDPDAPNIPTPRSYAEAIQGPYSSQWQTAMDAEMASWKSTGTYVDEVPPPGANIVTGMWIFRVKRLLGSLRVFKARYVARGFTAQRDYELHSLDFSTAFLQGSLHEEIWLHRPAGFTGSFPPGTQWSLRRPVYGVRQAPREWHETLRTTLAALGFAPSSADPSLILRIDTSLLPFYVLVYVDDLVFAIDDTEGLAHVKSELQKRHTCTDQGELRSYLCLRIIRDRAQRTITLTQSHMVQQVLQSFGFTYSSPLSTPLSSGFG
ncbi:unnamed protein product [Closterium sp. NIES-64]|nr:unnamed protein product [Closterium sp. NIES-64]